MKIFNLSQLGKVWMGTTESLHNFIQGEEKIPGVLARDDLLEADKGELPELLQIVRGSTAVINIAGTLVTNRSWYDMYVGRVSYPAIREAFTYALLNEDIERIVMMMDCPGGEANGVADLHNFIAKVGQRKTVLAHATGSMASGGYWLASAASYITASPTAIIGSIGAVIPHIEYSAMMEKEGVTATMIRSGPYKHLVNSYEKLSETALAEVQTLVDTLDAVFVDVVASSRGKDAPFVRQHMGQGRTFMGKSAKDIGLVDDVYLYDDMMGKLMSGAFDNPEHSNEHTILGGPQMATTLSAEQILTLAEQGIVVGDQTPTPAVTSEPAAPAVAAEPATTVTTAAAPAVATEPTTAVTGSQYIAHLEAKIAERDETILGLKVAAHADKAKIEQIEASLAPMQEIVTKVTERMAISMGQTGVDFSAMPLQALLTQHSQLQVAFAAKFKAGGVASAEVTTAPSPSADANAMKAIAAAAASTQLA